MNVFSLFHKVANLILCVSCFGSRSQKNVRVQSNSNFLPVLEPIIRFSEIKYSVREPQIKGDVAVVKIPILRVGDTSKVSVVRVHTKDGSATSGEDYNPLSEGEDLF